MNHERIKSAVFVLLMLFVVTVSFPLELHSDTYCYTAKNGTYTCVDDEGWIPNEYKNSVTVIKDKPAGSPEQKTVETDNSTQATEEGLEEEEKQEEPEKSLQTKVTIQGNHVLVPVTLGYKGTEIGVTLVLDTGAELVAIYQDIAKRLPITYSENASVRVPGGKVLNARLIKMDYIKVGPYTKPKMDVLVLFNKGPAVPHDGLLGMNFLRDFEYSIDFTNQVIKWKE